ncbi:ribonuclease H-like [Parasteatoda tepidariorum]|uniref:ribonuclease H-like n=1 Tax=Parasteatoda tepidariorum TaxID=114398 RepID=UPI00077FDEC3|nr:ribonuclease H-like [Parasteatoda tepidariorum]
MKQLAFKRINNVPMDAVQLHTDGGKLDSDRSGNGIYIKLRNQEMKIKGRNPHFCSVFRSEFIAILEGLGSIMSLSLFIDIWIFSNSKSAIQHLADWHNVRVSVGADILRKLKLIFFSHRIHFQWIPSHVDIAGNEIADSLAKAVSEEAIATAAPLTYLEHFSKCKAKNMAI